MTDPQGEPAVSDEPRMIRCPGSGERSDRVHSSGAVMCPACNGAYLSPGMRLPEHQAEAEKPTDLEELLGAIARGWCAPETSDRIMDSVLAEAIADEVLPLFVRLRTALATAEERANYWQMNCEETIEVEGERRADAEERATTAEERLKFAIPVPEGFVGELSELLDEDEVMDVLGLIEKYGVPSSVAEERATTAEAERDELREALNRIAHGLMTRSQMIDTADVALGREVKFYEH